MSTTLLLASPTKFVCRLLNDYNQTTVDHHVGVHSFPPLPQILHFPSVESVEVSFGMGVPDRELDRLLEGDKETGMTTTLGNTSRRVWMEE